MPYVCMRYLNALRTHLPFPFDISTKDTASYRTVHGALSVSCSNVSLSHAFSVSFVSLKQHKKEWGQSYVTAAAMQSRQPSAKSPNLGRSDRRESPLPRQ